MRTLPHSHPVSTDCCLHSMVSAEAPRLAPPADNGRCSWPLERQGRECGVVRTEHP